MTKEIQKNQKRKGINPIVAAMVGVGIAAAGVLTFKDKKNRDKAKKVLNNVKGKSQDYLKKAKNLLKEEPVQVKPKTVVKKKKAVAKK